MGDELKQAGDLEQDLAMRLAIAEQRAEAIPKLATQQVGMINALAQVDAQETLSIAGARQEAQAQEAALQGELYQTTGQTQYSGAYYEALIQSQAISSIASSDIQNIRDVAQAQASQAKGSAQARSDAGLDSRAVRPRVTLDIGDSLMHSGLIPRVGRGDDTRRPISFAGSADRTRDSPRVESDHA